MNFLSGLHGVVAIVLLCSLLFVEEAGVPLPFAPGELTLLAAGLLIAAGGLDPWVFIPVAFAVCVGGAMVGYSWARIVGEHSLTGLAARFHQARALERVARRIGAAGPVGIGVSRLIPGLRIYTTLVAGAFGVRRRTFLVGLVPSTAVWVVVFVVLGILVGIPVEHFLNQLARLAVQGAILVVIGVGGYLAIRRAPAPEREPLVNLPTWVRTSLAIFIDLGVVASILTGLLSIARRFTPTGLIASWADGVVLVAAVAAVYLFITRRGTGATVGEALLHTVYLPRHGARFGAFRRGGAETMDPALRSAAERLHALGTVPRLAVVRALIGGARTSSEVAQRVAISTEESEYHLAALSHVGLIEVEADGGDGDRYGVQEKFRGWMAEVLEADGPRPD
ncbi:MAG TPA: VTT domain-containing protein [Candidatus Nanopelagicaceae bacterium]|nr:VTT domain-containing protein [Candidatus Nanopelagicaceae bacterium]